VNDGIAQASATISVAGYGVTYDGNSHTATGTAKGAGGIDLSNALTLTGTTHTSAGNYVDAWSFHDATGNYADASGTVQDNIAKANAIVKVNGYSGIYDGAAHGAAGTVTGVDAGGTALGGSLNLGASFKNAPGGTAHWTFSGGANYNDQSGNVNIVIGAKTITGSITANNKVYDGTTTATIGGTSLAGVIAGDQVSLTVGPAIFASQNVGTWTVTASGLALSGASAGNYVLAATTATTTASITSSTTTTTLQAILSTACVINIAKDGSVTFRFSHVTGITAGQTVAQLFNGVQFSLKIGSTLFSGTSAARVVDGSIFVSWRMNHELRADFYALMNGSTQSAKTTVNLMVCATSRDGKYTLSEVVKTSLFDRGHEHDHDHDHDDDHDRDHHHRHTHDSHCSR